MKMKSGLKQLLTLLAALPAIAAADSYPSRPVTLVVAYAPGGMTDILTRRIAADLQTRLGQPFVVENRPGATGQIATEYVTRQKPDGYTVLVGATSHVINPVLKKLPYNARKDFEPVALLAVSPNFLLVNAGLGIKNYADFKAYAQKQPSVPYGTAGAGGAPHIVGELLRAQSGLPLMHVSYRGAGPAMTDLVSGQVPFGMAESVTANAYLQSGKIVPLAIASAQRQSRYPDVPTLNELGYKGFDLSTWVGAYAPAGTPVDIIQTLNSEIRKSVMQQATQEYIRSTGSEPGDMDLPTYRKFVGDEMDKWQAVITQAGVKDE
ncbi:Bug family tripartite tricarboxylate transporter substrate binding protein [Achromobacter deleyi]|uniref:Bug family tripartite tricarboxylate transporter substrate binding protein n=1 Tax=Achromobacter deleyi TaxID=1353891 RepID=UPI0014929566|nr:tripartite tricarboxylate transporter substrate binding protein [Achromobacter deleyi]QVQ26376.1 tripartite tricarboxylate transporter substrate binding protein [Achromobacter deleyi]UIP21940.1 tripartite tricarboxylate transporter substrate binding protein [Achromobacter deleyi]